MLIISSERKRKSRRPCLAYRGNIMREIYENKSHLFKASSFSMSVVTNTLVIRNRRKQHNEPIRIRSKYL